MKGKPNIIDKDTISVVSQLDPDHIPTATRRRFVELFGAGAMVGLAGCMGDDDESAEESEPEEEEDEEGELLDLSLEIPSAIEDGSPTYDGRLGFHDYTNVSQGLYMGGAVARGSEFGHENYRAELADDYMREMGEECLDCLDEVMDSFWEDGALTPELRERDGGWEPVEGVDIAEYPLAVYTYQAHHRGPRWEDEGHDDVYNGLVFSCAPYISSLGYYLLENHYEDGQFYHDTDRSEFDTESMANGLNAINGIGYAWVRYDAPDGESDMGKVDHSVLHAFLGYDEEELIEVIDEVVPVLDDHWDDERGIYDFGDGTEYDLRTLAALVRGHKALYEIPEIFGDGPDYTERFAERAAIMVERFLEADLEEPWGLPETVEYTTDGVVAASNTVDVAAQWEFITVSFGSWTITREREGELSPLLVSEYNDDLFDEIGEMTDTLLLGGMEYQRQDDGSVVAELDYETGDVIDDTHTASAHGAFLTGVGNVYRDHEAVERARDWDEADEELRDRSEAFHDQYVECAEQLREQFVR